MTGPKFLERIATECRDDSAFCRQQSKAKKATGPCWVLTFDWDVCFAQQNIGTQMLKPSLGAINALIVKGEFVCCHGLAVM